MEAHSEKNTVMVEKIFTGEEKLWKNPTDLKCRKTVRAAAYCRVSTDQEMQLSSLKEQIRSFQESIKEHPGWTLVDVYADEGLSGTSVKKRREFLRMIQDCEDGKIDYILTKSISRFARNTVECLSYVRHLQTIGVQIFFEKEGIDTGTAVSEMLLTVLAAFAQEESHSISENLKWGIRKRFEKGISRWTPTYGYRMWEDGAIVVQTAEAEVVKMVFQMYQRGVSIPEILEHLNALQIPSARGKKWTKTALQYLLQNEKYIGDKRLQKWVSIDHISHKSIRNDAAVVPVYYVKNTHPAIIDRHTFEQVQRIMELKNPRGEYCRYPYYDTMVICPICGKKLIPRIMHTQEKKRALCCFGEGGCHGYSIKTYLVDRALLEAYNGVDIENVTGIIRGERKSDVAADEWKLEISVRQEALERMLDTKRREQQKNTVHYNWLDDLVERITFSNETMQVYWKCGLKSVVFMKIPPTENPVYVAKLYRKFLNRIETGEYQSAKLRNVTEQKLEKTGGEACDYQKNQ